MAITPTFLLGGYLPITDTTQATQLVRGTLAFSGNYVAGGDVVNFATHTVGSASPVVSSRRCVGMQFWEEPASGTLPTGVAGMLFYRNVATKPNASNGVIQIVGSATMTAGTFAAGNELSAAAYPAAILAAKVFFEAIFVLGS
jgi:hypothetical protein